MFYPESFPSIHSLKILCRTFPTRGFVVVLSCIVFVVPSSLSFLAIRRVVLYDISTIFSVIWIIICKNNYNNDYYYDLPLLFFYNPPVKLITSKRKCTLPLSSFVIPVMAFLINLPVSFKTLLHQSGIIK